MNFIAKINVMPKKEILDPQGKAVRLGLENLGLTSIDEVRVGRHITMQLSAETEEEANKKVEQACKQLLANLIMEGYDYAVEPVAV